MNKQELDVQNLWEKVKNKVFGDLDPQKLELWVSPLSIKEVDENSVTIVVPNKYFSDWLVSNGYLEKIRSVISEELNSSELLEIKIDYIYDISQSQELTPEQKIDYEYIPEKVFVLKETFNPEYTFENFITDESNRFAKAVCETAAKQPGSAYNPIFIYAPVGLGKTHLLHAVGNKMLEMSRKFRIAYITADKFVSDYISALQNGKIDSFRSKFQNAIALLLDDVQFLIGKEKSQEEFFHIFNILFDNKKQIIITSDRKPQELKGIEERLISRFEWGVIADIGRPSLELRLAILKHKSQKQKIFVPEDVLRYIAENITENIRRLEGALLKVVAKAITENLPLTIDTVKEILKDIIEPQPKPISIQKIIEVVAEEFKISKNELLSKKRTDALALPRQFGMYLAKKLTDLSYLEIAESFGRKDHTTAYHAYTKIRELIAYNPYYAQILNRMIEKIRNG
ncbi:MAG: chromosomal replication initiator protein DnaA [Elusimicrobiota bacterium]|nr:chromosomal replication initiator protein DnaA [Endomicrobiia bacterium]MDW8165042.1 chromosomal replication initiator protein DnaA [Elusimicrobiota bacterium]